MHCTLLAPELSATSRTVLIWIMAPLLLHELLDEARDDPALVPADRARLLDLHLVARLELALLVVRLVAAARADVLAVQGVAAVTDHLDDHGLGHLRLDDPPGHLASKTVRCLVLGRGRLRDCRFVRHDFFASLFLAALALGADSAFL